MTSHRTPARPRLHPWRTVLRADHNRILLSADAWTPLTPADSAAVRRTATALDGTLTWQQVAADPHLSRGLTLLLRHGALVDADEVPPGAPDARRLLDRARLTLAATGAAGPGATVARRPSRTVLVFGGGGIGQELAAGLARCGLDARKAGPRTEADGDDVAVAVGHRPWSQIQRWAAMGISHLAVSPRAASVRVGPLVVPGETACLQCLHLARLERRPHWRTVSGQLDDRPLPQPDPVLVQHAVATAARQLVALLQHDSSPACGAYWEVTLTDVAARRVPVARHPQCGCWWPRFPAEAEPVGTADLTGTQ